MNNRLKNRIQDLREERRMSRQNLADAIEPATSHAQIYRLEMGQRKLTHDWMVRIAKALRVAPEDLLPNPGGKPPSPLLRESVVDDATPLRIGSTQQPIRPKDVPILGHAKAGVSGLFIDNGTVRGLAMRPESLDGITDAYAVFVQDDSMFPAFKPGKLVYINPIRPVQAGDDVVIQLTDGQALIKTLKRRTERVFLFTQYNPADEIRIKPSEIKALHYIATTDR